MNYELESRMVEFGIIVDYFTMDDIIDGDVPNVDFDYEDDLPI